MPDNDTPAPRFGTSEWHALQKDMEDRKAFLRGSHIRDDSEGSSLIGLPPDILANLARVATSSRDNPVNTPKPRMDWTWSVTNILTLVGMLAGLLVGGVSFNNALKDNQANNDRHFDDMMNHLKEIQLSEDVDRHDIENNKKLSDDRAAANIPRIQASEQVNANQSESLRDLRNIVGDLAKVVGQTHEDIAVMRTQMDMRRASGPHGALETHDAQQQLGMVK